jgi:hypothetical protein
MNKPEGNIPSVRLRRLNRMRDRGDFHKVRTGAGDEIDEHGFRVGVDSNFYGAIIPIDYFSNRWFSVNNPASLREAGLSENGAGLLDLDLESVGHPHINMPCGGGEKLRTNGPDIAIREHLLVECIVQVGRERESTEHSGGAVAQCKVEHGVGIEPELIVDRPIDVRALGVVDKLLARVGLLYTQLKRTAFIRERNVC